MALARFLKPAKVVLGPSTRKAIEAFERAKGLPVTGKLGTATLQALRTHTAAVIQ
jgi:peptidoglycan hydrolase-like protein with peptidoglycan-binding domain